MEDAVELWRRCEDAWAAWLGRSAGVVMRLTDATSNTAHSGAPLMQVGDRRRRAPDLLAMGSDGKSEYWEVKTRTRADVDGNTGQRRHWMPFEAYDDYLAVAEHTGAPVHIVLYEAASATAPGRWLCIDVEHLREVGTLEERWVAQGRRVRAWMWPVGEMTPVDGPVVDESAESDLAPSSGAEAPVPRSDLEPVERELRRRRRRASVAEPPASSEADPPAPLSRLHEWLDSEPVAALDVLRRRLGIPTLPRYSVLRVGLDGVDVDDLLGLLHYGIRVFVVADQTLTSSMPDAEVRAFRGARLLETAVVSDTGGLGEWVVDGTFAAGAAERLHEVLAQADDSGQLNVSQYRVVHAPADADVVVQAGAGTGKTETMSERIVFLLATGARSENDGGLSDLRADEIGLVTFTREAAAEMRSRVGRSLLLRQRLCRRCAQPALAWMLQLAGADIATIHSLARRVAASSAGLLGLGPDFRVRRLTMEFRGATQQRLTDDLTRLVDRFPGKVPAAYEWQRHVSTLWEALENNGVDLMRLADEPRGSVALDWGGLPGDGLEAEVARLTQQLLERVADDMRVSCLEQQVLPTNQLVPSATAALEVQEHPPVRRYKYLFIDEFQDTDPAQMDLFLKLRGVLGLRLFAVGDVKQGIYRFRGASGNAFEELFHRWPSKVPLPAEYPLNRNFRSGKALLDSVHRPFSSWGGNEWLPYDAESRLEPRAMDEDRSRAFETRQVSRDQETAVAASLVESWWTRFRGESIGILCRQNGQALKVQEAVRQQHPADPVPCEILVGGAFYQSPVVREMRVLLEAVADPHDDAALLELAETRWGAGLLLSGPPLGVAEERWGAPMTAPLDWQTRLAAIGVDGNIRRDDLVGLRTRVHLLRELVARMPLLSWLVECDRALAPSRYLLMEQDAETERQRYARGLDHLVTLMDTTFGDQPLSLERLLGWVRLQVATNHAEDEPDTTTEGKVVALTVHKAKGLEFDRVVVPWTDTPFGTPDSVSTRAAVRDDKDGPPRLLWQWHLNKRKLYESEFTNLPPQRHGEWRDDDDDTLREETRLLYVAMTRARHELVLLRGPRGRGGSNRPDSWGDLLEGAV